VLRLFASAAVLSMLCLSGCGSTGGTLGGLVPAPKFLKGQVVGSTYYAPDGGFQIDTPHPATGNSRETYEWSYGRVKEGSDGPLKFVEFGPFAFDRNSYSVDVVPKRPGQSAENAAKFWWGQSNRSGEFRELIQLAVDLDQKSAYYSAYRNIKQDYILVTTFIEFDDHVANVYATVRQSPGLPVSEARIIQRSWKRYNDFAGSLRIPGTLPK